MCWNVSFGKTLYIKNLKTVLSLYTSKDDFMSLSVKDLCAFNKDETLSRIQLLPSLRLLSITLRTWWKRNISLFSSRSCHILTSYKVGNVS